LTLENESTLAQFTQLVRIGDRAASARA